MLKRKNNLENMYVFFIYVLPIVLFFSYHPLIHFGNSESMNLEISLSLIWLVLFDFLSFFIIVKKGKLKNLFLNIKWFILPLFMIISLLWSQDFLRGLLIGGVFLLLCFAGFSFFTLREFLQNKRIWRNFCKIFLSISIIVCLWCFLQCILDILGVDRAKTLMCVGCVYEMLGFPHPNGFAAEPQIMGNLLLAPIVLTIILIDQKKMFDKKILLAVLFILVVTLFLTLSRGAIFAFIIGIIFLTIIKIVKTKSYKALSYLVLFFISFLACLTFQGVLSEFSPTNDTFISGINKVVNHLTLGVVDFGKGNVKKEETIKIEEIVQEDNIKKDEKSEIETEKEEGVQKVQKAKFDGYIESSTSGRLTGWKAALKTWGDNPKNVIFGVGLGGGLKAMYDAKTTSTSNQIVNNQYVNFLLETGIIGVIILVVTIIWVIKLIMKVNYADYLVTLVVMYMITLMFFSGLPNALHIYLLPPILMVFLDQSSLRKKLVS